MLCLQQQTEHAAATRHAGQPGCGKTFGTKFWQIVLTLYRQVCYSFSMTNKRSAQRLQTLGYILSDGLNYEWFGVEALDDEAVTATLNVDTGDVDDNDEPILKRVEITADDVARGLRMYEEALNGEREFFPGAWKYDAKDAVRRGVIANVDEFVPTVHARVSSEAYARQTVLFSRTNGDDGDYDANTADSVLQFATLGYTIFG